LRRKMPVTEQPLVALKDIIALAEARETCIPAFDVGGGNPDFVRAVLDVCREEDSVALFIGWVGAVRNFGFHALVSLVRGLAAEAGVPTALELDHAHLVRGLAAEAGVPTALELDHAHEEADVRAAIEAGFTAVMFDCSDAPFQENVERTRTVVEYGREAGVAVEAALGHIAGRDESVVTDPAQAAEFVQLTGIDMLTPAVGNRHGCRGFTVPLDWQVIEKLNGAVRVPMALHGGSGISLEDVRRAAGFGFRKVNVATRLHMTYTGAVRDYVRENPEHGWFRWSTAGREALKTVVTEYVDALELGGTATELRTRP